MHDEYLRRIRGGNDAEALARLIELDQESIYRFMHRRLGHRHDAEDATQELFRRVLSSLPCLRDPKGYRGWLYRIALRVAQAQVQSRIGERHRVEALARKAVGSAPAASSDADDRRAQVRAALQSLEEDLRTVVVLRYEQGLSYEEIAEATRRPVGTVSKRLHTAHQKLQQTLAGIGAAAAAGSWTEALAAPAGESIPPGLAARLRQMALEAPPPSAPVSLVKVGAWAAAGAVVFLFLGSVVIRQWAAGPSSDASSNSWSSVRHRRWDMTPDARPSAASSPAGSVQPPAPGGPALPAVVRGRVIDRLTRASVSGAEIQVSPRDRSAKEPEARTTTRSDGTFHLQISPGSYQLDVLASGYVRHQFDRIMEAFRIESVGGHDGAEKEANTVRDSTHLDLVPGSETERIVELTAGLEIRGVVVDRSGRAVAKAKVAVEMLEMRYVSSRDPGHSSEHTLHTSFEPDGKTATYLTDFRGKFAIPYLYPAGTLELSVSCPGFETLMHLVPLDGKDRDEILVLDRGTSYGGSVRTREGQPVPGACVFLLGMPGKRPDAMTTGPGGEFLAVDQHRGATLVAAYAPGFMPQVSALPGQDPSAIGMTLARAESIVTGIVTDESGLPLDDVSVAVNNYEIRSEGTIVQLGFVEESGGGSMTSDGDSTISEFLPPSVRPPRASSADGGAFQLGGVALSSQTEAVLRFSKPGYVSLEVRATPNAPLRAVLRPAKP